MSKIISESSVGVKRQTIAPNIFMEKFQEKVNSKTYYVIIIELKLLNVLDFTVDFTGSNNVRFENQSSLIKNTKIQPFSKVEIARLLLEKKWNVKTKFKFTLQMPSLTAQREYLLPIFLSIQNEVASKAYMNKIDFGSMPDSESFEYFASNKTQFIDHDFPPIFKSIDNSEEDIVKKFECLIHWRRIPEVLLTDEERESQETVMDVFLKGINPMDVKQGKLGDCWLLSSIASLAEHPKLVERIILTKQANKHGYYRIKLCKMSKWKILTLDDYVPCFPLGETIFSRNQDKEIWVLLLEKAFAKLYGSYGRLIGGDCKHGLIDLTGCPTFSYDLTQDKIKEKIASGEMWNRTSEWDKSQYLITAATKELSAQKTSQVGLVKEHAYSVLRVVEVDNEIFGLTSNNPEDKVTRLLNMRNPWGVFEWTGDWSDSSSKWTPQLINCLGVNLNANDGDFWISWEDFLQNFDTLTVCKISGWHELRIKGKFVKSFDQTNEKINHFCSRWYYEIDVRQQCKIIFGIHQEDERFVGVKETRPYLDIGLAVVRHENGVYKLIDFKNTDFEREKYLELSLEPGTYYLVPRSNGNCIYFNQESKVEVTDFSSSNPIVTSVLHDIFEKYDIVANEFLSYKELKAFYEYIGLTLNEQQYDDIVNKFGKKEFKNANVEGLSEKGFINLFYSLIENKPLSYIKDLFEKLGYNSCLFSNRTRVFMVTIHSDKPVNMSIKDALADNIDFVTTKLLIKKYGKSMDEDVIGKVSAADLEVRGFYYFNE